MTSELTAQEMLTLDEAKKEGFITVKPNQMWAYVEYQKWCTNNGYPLVRITPKIKYAMVDYCIERRLVSEKCGEALRELSLKYNETKKLQPIGEAMVDDFQGRIVVMKHNAPIVAKQVLELIQTNLLIKRR